MAGGDPRSEAARTHGRRGGRTRRTGGRHGGRAARRGDSTAGGAVGAVGGGRAGNGASRAWGSRNAGAADSRAGSALPYFPRDSLTASGKTSLKPSLKELGTTMVPPVSRTDS